MSVRRNASGPTIYAYVNGNPLSIIDPAGLSGQWKNVPGSSGTRVRIDPPHPGGGPKRHAHVQQGGDTSKANEIVVNEDGTGSHGSKDDDLDRLTNKVKKWLRQQGINVKACGQGFAASVAEGVATEQCNNGNQGACSSLPFFGVDPSSIPDGGV